jgi:hypothetical protein
MNAPLVKAYFEKSLQQPSDLCVFFQDEHNLVLPGGRSLNASDPIGTIESIFNPAEKYHVRVVNKSLYYSSDVVIEYNQPNIENIKSSGIFPAEITNKIVYAPSIPFDYCNQRTRDLPVLTNFINEAESRRALLIDRLRKVCSGYQNVQGVYDLDGIRNLYLSAKVIVNPHQTLHHHSIEEFRVLPALSCGCIVVSEDVPLRTHIPYHDYIIWCSYEDIADVTIDVINRYDDYFERIHGESSGLASLLTSMKTEFEESMTSLLADTEYFSLAARLKRNALRVGYACSLADTEYFSLASRLKRSTLRVGRALSRRIQKIHPRRD